MKFHVLKQLRLDIDGRFIYAVQYWGVFCEKGGDNFNHHDMGFSTSRVSRYYLFLQKALCNID